MTGGGGFCKSCGGGPLKLSLAALTGVGSADAVTGGGNEKLFAIFTMFSKNPGWKLDKMSLILGTDGAAAAGSTTASAAGGVTTKSRGQGSTEKSLSESSGFAPWRSICGMGLGLLSLFGDGSGSEGSLGSLLSKNSGRSTVISRSACTLASLLSAPYSIGCW